MPKALVSVVTNVIEVLPLPGPIGAFAKSLASLYGRVQSDALMSGLKEDADVFAAITLAYVRLQLLQYGLAEDQARQFLEESQAMLEKMKSVRGKVADPAHITQECILDYMAPIRQRQDVSARIVSSGQNAHARIRSVFPRLNVWKHYAGEISRKARLGRDVVLVVPLFTNVDPSIMRSICEQLKEVAEDTDPGEVVLSPPTRHSPDIIAACDLLRPGEQYPDEVLEEISSALSAFHSVLLRITQTESEIVLKCSWWAGADANILQLDPVSIPLDSATDLKQVRHVLPEVVVVLVQLVTDALSVTRFQGVSDLARSVAEMPRKQARLLTPLLDPYFDQMRNFSGRYGSAGIDGLESRTSKSDEGVIILPPPRRSSQICALVLRALAVAGQLHSEPATVGNWTLIVFKSSVSPALAVLAVRKIGNDDEQAMGLKLDRRYDPAKWNDDAWKSLTDDCGAYLEHDLNKFVAIQVDADEPNILGNIESVLNM